MDCETETSKLDDGERKERCLAAKRDTLLARNKEVYTANKETILAKKKENYAAKRETLLAKRKENYAANREIILARKKEVYTANQGTLLAKKKEVYTANRETVLARKKKVYTANQETLLAKQKEVYTANRETVLARKKKVYTANQETLLAKQKEVYTANRETILARKRENYAAKRETIVAARKKHNAKNRKAVVAQQKSQVVDIGKAFQGQLQQTIGQAVIARQYHSLNKDRILQRKRINTVRNTLLTRSNRFIARINCMKLKGSVEVYTRRLALKLHLDDRVEDRIAAERIIKWVLHKRSTCVKQSKAILKKAKVQVMAMLTRLEECRLTVPSVQLSALCGQSRHSSSSEPYFHGCTYKPFVNRTKAIAISEQGQAAEIFPAAETSKRKRAIAAAMWSCSKETCNLDVAIITERTKRLLKEIACVQPRNLLSFAKRLDACKRDPQFSRMDKMGHPMTCHMSLTSCPSSLLFLRNVGPHFPELRNLLKKVYELRKWTLRMGLIDDALKAIDVVELTATADAAERDAREFPGDSDRDYVLESDILERYKSGHRAFTKRSLDLPVHDCISCEKLCFGREVRDLRRLHKPLGGEAWKHLQEHNAAIPDKADCHMICKYCLGKFRLNEMPPTCLLNGLLVKPVPPEISRLNTFELPLVQRARSFQTILRMGTVTNRHVPNRERVRKAVGRIIHLPLPTEQTLKRLPLPQDPVNKNPEIYIFVRSLPNKTNVIWEDLVNVDHVHAALLKLKQSNQLYKDIVLPAQPADLLDGVEPQVLFEAGPLDDSQDVDDPEPISSYEDLGTPAADELPAAVVPDRDGHESVDDNVEPDERRASGGPAEAVRAMLTQVDPETREFDYQEYTIHPMYELRDSRSASALYQMLRVNEPPIDYRDPQIDVKCFPGLFCEGLYGQFHPRNSTLTSAEFIKSRLKSKHSRFRLDQQFLFYLVNDANVRQLSAGIYQKMKIVNPRARLTAAQCLSLMSREELEGDLNTIFSRLRNTEPFWVQPRNNLTCMTQNYGPATWFLTLSPSEWDWGDLHQYLRDVNTPAMQGKPVSELIALDPVSTSRFIENKFRAMLEMITADAAPLGKLTHYFWRREYQGRGMQHFHMLLWVEGAPVLGVATPEEVARFIMDHVTCRVPNKERCPTLHDRVMRYQVHKDNAYCLRKKKTKAGDVRVCRFGFPRQPTDVFKLHDVVTSISGRKSLSKKCRLYELPRSDKEVRVNDYNEAIMLVWIGNMDLQYISEQSAVLNRYVTKYTTKAEKGHLRETFDLINSTKSLCSRLHNFGLRALSHRECGALEAADTLLGISLYGTDPDTTFRWIDVNMVRSRRLKGVQEVRNLDPDSTDLFYESWVDSHYPSRPEALLDVSLFDFVAWFDIVKALPTGEMDEGYRLANGRYIKKRKRPHLINHFRFKVQLVPEKYYYSLLLLFKPWTDVDELKGGHDTFAAAFDAAKEDLLEANRYNAHLQEIEDAAMGVREQVEARLCQMDAEADAAESNELPVDPLGFAPLPVEAQTAMGEFRDAAELPLGPDEVTEIVAALNADQRRVFDGVVESLTKRTDADTVLRRFVSGVGGTGKSYVIHALRSWVKVHLRKDVAVAAPTGIAAYNVNGMTIYRLLQLPVEHGDTPKYKELSDAAIKVIRDELRNVVLFIIDEISMVSNLTLMYIHLRLSEVFGTKDTEDGWFGKLSLLVFGDLLQLPPVHDFPPFVRLTGKQVDKYLGSLSVVNLWRELFTYDELTINMRQLNDIPFVELLHRMRLGIVTGEDCRLLETRKVTLAAETVHERLRELSALIAALPSETVCLLPTRNLCSALNDAMLKEIRSEEILLLAEDRLDCARNAGHVRKRAEKWLAKHEDDCSRTAGLESTIIVKVGAKVMLRRNIDVTIGLVNGALGTVLSVLRSVEQSKTVESVKVEFSSGMVKDIQRVEARFEVLTGAYVYRKQFPISVSYGITIHKCQGLTLRSAVLDIGTSVFSCGQIYVALSRVSKLEGLHLINFNPSDVKALPSAIVEYNRLRNLHCSGATEIPIPGRQPAKRRVYDTVWAPNASALAAQRSSTHVTTSGRAQKAVGVLRRGFSNSDGASCYANAALQCMLHIDALRNQLENQPGAGALKELALAYTQGTDTMDAMPIRALVDDSIGGGENFVCGVQQDASEFLMALTQTSAAMMDHTRFGEQWEKRCCNCGMSNTIDVVPSHMLHVDLPEAAKDKITTLQMLVDRAFAWESIDCVCDQCSSGPVQRRLSIQSEGPLIVLHLKVFQFVNNVANKITDLKLPAVPSSVLKLDGHVYRPVCGIFHVGSQLKEGHYRAYLRQGTSWDCADDELVGKGRWPNLAKDLMLVVLQQTS